MKAHIAANRRLAILKLLIESAGVANDSVLHTAMKAIGHVAELDRTAMRVLIKELEERDCLTTEMVHGTVMVATITERGRMAAVGHCAIDGVASPHGG